jgi:UDP-2,3-diacylglucosamine pyrophosphatase LpxH
MAARKLEIAVISDVHLGTYGCHADELLTYLKSIRPEILILNGDIIDCWQFRKGYFPSSHMKIIHQIFRFAADGSKVYYLTGNHDDVLRKFSGLDLGNIYLRDKLQIELNGEQVLFFHGDIFDVSIRHSKWLAKLGGRSYDLLIRINRYVNKILLRMGRPRISFSRKIKSSVKRAVQFVSDFEQSAADWALRNKCQRVVCGHIHQPGIKKISGRKERTAINYMNSGDWVESLSALEYDGNQWSVFQYELDFIQPSPQSKVDPASEDQPWGLDQVSSLQLLLEREKRRALKGRA